MSFFVLHDKNKYPDTAKHFVETMAQNDFSQARVIEVGKYTLTLFGDLSGNSPHFYENLNGDFISTLGSISYKGQKAPQFYAEILNNFDIDTFKWKDLIGTYVIILQKNDCLYVISDGLGCCQIYANEDYSLFSNSFVAMCEINKTQFFDTQACYEYVINGSVFGNKTLLKGVSTLAANTVLKIANSSIETLQLDSPIRNSPTPENLSLDEIASYHCSQLDSVFEPLVKAYGDNIKLSFSGGFDSRLSLAMLMRHGIKPSLFVYGTDTDEDVIIARTVCKAENLELECINKSNTKAPELDQYSEIIIKNFYAFDGWKVEYGIFDFGVDVKDRLSRHTHGKIPLNGSLGEIYRNFFYIPDRKVTTHALVSTFYSQYDPKSFTAKFKEKVYAAGMSKTMRESIDADSDELKRYQIEQLYPNYRGRFWTGRDAQLNQRFGSMLFPFLEHVAISDTSKIPIKHKDFGYLQGRMIAQMNSQLAAYPSDYGFSLNGNRPLTYRLKTHLSTQRPPFIRKLSFRLKHRIKESVTPPLSPEYLSQIIDIDFPIMRNLFNIDLINSAKQYGLIATLENIGERYNLEVE